MHESLLQELDAHLPALQALCTGTQAALEAALATRGIGVQFVNGRVKSRPSLLRKLARPDKTYRALWDVTDLVGLRVVTYFENTIEQVARLVEDAFKVDYAHSSDRLRDSDSRRFGYRSLHYVCSPAADAPHPAFRFELQVRTALQHAWAEVEHDLGYKADSLPDHIRRRFSRVAGLLEIADEEFVSLRHDLAEYQEQARSVLAAAQSLPLDALSLAALVHDPRIKALDGAIAEQMHKRLGDEVFFPGYLTSLLRLAGFSHTRDVLDAVERYGPEAPSLVAPYFSFAAETWQLDARSLQAVQRGYGLFFLAHVAILRGPELSISKVARLTRLYQELDYPGDEQTAHRVASGLLSALQRAHAPHG
jgi:putative GTP pyrophosphokinase